MLVIMMDKFFINYKSWSFSNLKIPIKGDSYNIKNNTTQLNKDGYLMDLI